MPKSKNYGTDLRMTGSEVLTCRITLDFLFSTEIFLSSTIYCAKATRNLTKKTVIC